MKVQPAAFLRTTLPLGIDMLEQYDSGRYHSIWLPDHMVSFWPDSIWTPEFTDLATASPSPHRHLDAHGRGRRGGGADQQRADRDQRRRHRAPPSRDAGADGADHRPSLARAASSWASARARLENTVPYGFDFDEAGQPLRGGAQGHQAAVGERRSGRLRGPVLPASSMRGLDTELYDGKCPPIWIGAAGPRMLDITGRYADGWWPRARGRRRTTRPSSRSFAIPPSGRAATRWRSCPRIIQICLIGDDDEMAEMLEAPLVKSIMLMLTAEDLREFGYEHPMGPTWRGYQDIDPGMLTRERIIAVLRRGRHAGDPRHHSRAARPSRWRTRCKGSAMRACGCSR